MGLGGLLGKPMLQEGDRDDPFLGLWAKTLEFRRRLWDRSGTGASQSLQHVRYNKYDACVLRGADDRRARFGDESKLSPVDSRAETTSR